VDEREPAKGLGLVEKIVDGAADEPREASPTRGAVHIAMVRVGSSVRDAATMRPHRTRRSPVGVRAYVLIQTEVGKAATVATKVAEIPGVARAEDVTGPYDVIVQAEADTVDELGKIVVSRVQLIEGITRTLTCPVVNL
jgi:DNA-binding Lrp family transcriptional regulator